jgi:hypothetical protein
MRPHDAIGGVCSVLASRFFQQKKRKRKEKKRKEKERKERHSAVGIHRVAFWCVGRTIGY